MSTSAPAVESKSAKKRKAKAAAIATEPAPSSNNDQVEASVNGSGEHESNSEHHYLKELSKQIRSISKKLSGMSKAEAVVADNPGISLDDLVTQKKLNNDQRAQLSKKPQLEAQLTQLEEQQKHFSEFARDFESRFTQDKTTLQDAHLVELSKLKEESAASAASTVSAKVEDALKTVAQFLYAAASRRQGEVSDETESKAFEGVLYHMYQGDATALQAMMNLVQGKDEKVKETNDIEVDYTFAKLRAVVRSDLSEDAATSTKTAIETAKTEEPKTNGDPTVANAGLTELGDTTITQNPSQPPEPNEDGNIVVPIQASTEADGANAVAEAAWNPEASAVTSNGEDWVQVPRDPAETETGLTATPADKNNNSQTWAEESTIAAEEEAVVAAENEGFSEVRRDRGGRGGGRGGNRGFRGGDHRGRGRGRAEFRGHRGQGGRGRGGPRGGSAQVPTPSNTAP